MFDYDDLAGKYNGKVAGKDTGLLIKTVTPDWDNTARRGVKATIFHQSTPEKFKNWLKEAIKKTKANNPAEFQIVFINAWNEWAEGAYLEPDRKKGYSYLNATQQALIETSDEHKNENNPEDGENPPYKTVSGNSLLFFISNNSKKNDIDRLLGYLRWLSKNTFIDLCAVFEFENAIEKEFRDYCEVFTLEAGDKYDENSLTNTIIKRYLNTLRVVYVLGSLDQTTEQFLVHSNIPVIIGSQRENVEEKLFSIDEGLDGNEILEPEFIFYYVLKEPSDEACFQFLSSLRKISSMKPAISVVVPCFNHAEFLPKRLDSIVNQTFRDIEVILLDDASSDGTLEILKDYSAHYGFKLASNENNSGNPFVQWAKGIELATSNLIWIAEDDDYCEPEFLEYLLPAFEDSAVKMVYCASNVVDEFDQVGQGYEDYLKPISSQKWNEDYKVLGAKEVLQALSIKNTIPNVSAVLFKKPKVERFKESLLEYKFAGDWFFYLNLIKWGYVAYINKPLNYHRRHSSSVMSSVYSSMSYFEELEKLYRYILDTFLVDEGALVKIRDRILSEWNHLNPGKDISILNESFFLDELDEILNEKRFSKPLEIVIGIGGFYFGGAEIFPIRIANQMAKMGHIVHLFNSGELPADARVRNMVSKEVNIVEIPWGVNTESFVKEYFTENDIDILNTHGWNAEAFFTRNTTAVKTPWIASMHGHHEAIIDGKMKYNGFKELFPEAISRVDKFIYTAPKNLKVFDYYPMQEEAQAVKIPFLGMSDELPPARSRKELGIPEDSFVLGMIARGIPEKGWEIAIECVRQLKENYNVHLVLIGDSDYVQKLKKRFPEDYIHFLGYSDDELGWGQIYDVGLLPTYYVSESHPMCIMGYLACGNPVISSPIGMIPEMLDAGDGDLAGFLLALGAENKPSSVELSSFVTKYIEDQDFYRKHKGSAVKAFEKFNIENTVKNYLKVYVEAIRKRNSSEIA